MKPPCARSAHCASTGSPDGMTRLVALLDPENAAFVTDAIDRVTAPRRGGVRFVDPDEQQRAIDVAADPRTTEQLAFDAFVTHDPPRGGRRRRPGLRFSRAGGARPRPCRASRAPTGLRVDRRGVDDDLARHGRTPDLHGGSPADRLPRRRPAAEARAIPTALLGRSAHRTRGPRWRMPHTRVRKTTVVVRSASHRRMGQASWRHRCGLRGTALPTSPHVGARHRGADRAGSRWVRGAPRASPTRETQLEEPGSSGSRSGIVRRRLCRAHVCLKCAQGAPQSALAVESGGPRRRDHRQQLIAELGLGRRDLRPARA